MSDADAATFDPSLQECTVIQGPAVSSGGMK